MLELKKKDGVRMIEIMQSIHKNWTCKIFSGKKTLELRKNKPSGIEYPIKVYIYEPLAHGGCGMVVGDYILKFEPINSLFENRTKLMSILSTHSCVSSEYIVKYQAGKGTIYAWRISNCQRYDSPKALIDFGLGKPPQSWCYLSNSNMRGVNVNANA